MEFLLAVDRAELDRADLATNTEHMDKQEKEK
jgi:hypothetical protein